MSAINVCDKNYASCMKQNEPVASSLPSTPLDGLEIKGKKCAKVIDGFMCGKDFYELKDGGKTLVYNQGQISSRPLAKRHALKGKVLISKKVENAEPSSKNVEAVSKNNKNYFTKANFDACRAVRGDFFGASSWLTGEDCLRRSKDFNYLTPEFEACYETKLAFFGGTSWLAANMCEKKLDSEEQTCHVRGLRQCGAVFSGNPTQLGYSGSPLSRG